MVLSKAGSRLAAVDIREDDEADHPCSISFLTDVEGNWEYFCSFVELSPALTLMNGGALNEKGAADIVLADDWHLVFGGDVCDKGGPVGGTIRVVQSLIRLKRRYPDRVHLLIGNRDANKMRMTSELHPSEIARLHEVVPPSWVPANRRVSPLDALRSDLKRDGREEEASEAELQAANTLARRVCWMLQHTMGAEGDFERRRSEIALLRRSGSVHAAGMATAVDGEVSDEETAQSYVASVGEGGFMREYLELSQLGLVLNRTLFLHGGLVGSYRSGSSICYGHVPGQKVRVLDTRKWVGALNAWAMQQVADWLLKPYWVVAPDGSRTRGGEELMDYVAPNSEPSVVMGRHLDPSGMPKALPNSVVECLLASNIYRLLVGHTPHGNCPTVIKQTVEPSRHSPNRYQPIWGDLGGEVNHEDVSLSLSRQSSLGSRAASSRSHSGTSAARPLRCKRFFEVVMADTSYSDMSATDYRGAAVSEVQVLSSGEVHVHGVLEDARQLSYTLGATPSPADLVGLQELVGGKELAPFSSIGAAEEDATGNRPSASAFVKARLCEPEQYLFCHVQGFVVTYHTLDEEEALSMSLPRSPSFSEFPVANNHAELIMEDEEDDPECTPFRRLLSARLSSSGSEPVQMSEPSSFRSRKRSVHVGQEHHAALPTDRAAIVSRLATEIERWIFGHHHSRTEEMSITQSDLLDALDSLPEVVQVLVRSKASLQQFLSSTSSVHGRISRTQFVDFLTRELENEETMRLQVAEAVATSKGTLESERVMPPTPSEEAMGRLCAVYGETPSKEEPGFLEAPAKMLCRWLSRFYCF
ncbi:hypothetical protein AB1Y20_015091 [Prymnesium parvum]|uniref:Calcineurin-like phosphoesterase domain-containing protein n=1 Tax=Prymnesium parvum TaxID=97485 RepID=A0AB34JZD4_PRYPA